MAYPASVYSGDANIQHIQGVTYYQRKAIANLKGFTATFPLFEKQNIPQKNGKIMQFYENNLMTPLTTPVSEGTPGAPLASAGSIKGTVTLQQYANYMTFSDFILETSISNTVAEHAEEFGFAAARVVDILNYAQMDAAATAAAALMIDLAASPTPDYFSASVARRAVASLEAANVNPKNGGYYAGVMHALVAFDYTNDNTAGGVLDILKYNDYSQLKRGFVGNQVITLDGIRWVKTSLTTSTANFGGGGQIGYHNWVVGENAFFATSLDFSDVPQEENFKVDTINFARGSQLSDPAGLIKSALAYNFKYATYVPPTNATQPRFRRIRCEASVT